MTTLSNTVTYLDIAKSFALSHTTLIENKIELETSKQASIGQNLELTRAFFDMLKQGVTAESILPKMDEMRDIVRTAFMASPSSAFPPVEGTKDKKSISSTQVRETKLKSALTLLNRCFLVATEYFTGKCKDKDNKEITCEKVSDSDDILSPVSASTRRDKANRKASASPKQERLGTAERKFIQAARNLGTWKALKAQVKIDDDGIVIFPKTKGFGLQLAAFDNAMVAFMAMVPDDFE